MDLSGSAHLRELRKSAVTQTHRCLQPVCLPSPEPCASPLGSGVWSESRKNSVPVSCRQDRDLTSDLLDNQDLRGAC